MPNKASHIAIKQDDFTLDDVRRYYFEHAKRTLQVDDAKYLLERALELGLNHENGGLEALFSTLKYKFEK